MPCVLSYRVSLSTSYLNVTGNISAPYCTLRGSVSLQKLPPGKVSSSLLDLRGALAVFKIRLLCLCGTGFLLAPEIGMLKCRSCHVVPEQPRSLLDQTISEEGLQTLRKQRTGISSIERGQLCYIYSAAEINFCMKCQHFPASFVSSYFPYVMTHP